MIKVFDDHLEIETAGSKSLKACFEDFAAEVRSLGDDVLIITDSDNVLEFQNKEQDSVLSVYDPVHHCLIINVYLADDRAVKPIYVYDCYEFLEAKRFIKDVLIGITQEGVWIDE